MPYGVPSLFASICHRFIRGEEQKAAFVWEERASIVWFRLGIVCYALYETLSTSQTIPDFFMCKSWFTVPIAVVTVV